MATSTKRKEMIQQKPCAIVILNWNGASFLSAYLPILLQKTNPVLATIYVVDNDSTDASFEVVKQFETIQWISNDKNYGFAQGYNEGLKNITEPILCIMNSDIEVSDQWLEPILNAFQQNSSLGACQPKILDLKNKQKFEYAGASGGFIDRFAYPVCRGRFFEDIETDLGQYDDAIPIFWASGCCLFIRNEVFREVGEFDGDYFAHQEEIDLCWRVQNYGYEVYVFPKSVVYHYGGGSLPYGSYLKSYLNFRNSLFNIFKNVDFPKMLLVVFIRLILDGIAAIHSIFDTKSFRVVKAIFMAHMAFYINIPKLIRKRKQIKYKGFPKTTFKKYILIDRFWYRCTKFTELLN